MARALARSAELKEEKAVRCAEDRILRTVRGYAKMLDTISVEETFDRMRAELVETLRDDARQLERLIVARGKARAAATRTGARAAAKRARVASRGDDQ